MAKCRKCNSELRIVSEQVGVDSKALPIFHRIAYCDTCRTRMDIDSVPIQNQNREATLGDKSTVWGIVGMSFSIFGLLIVLFSSTSVFFAVVGLGLSIVGILDKKRRKHGTAIAGIIIAVIAILLSIFTIQLRKYSNAVKENQPSSTISEDSSQTQSVNSDNGNNPTEPASESIDLSKAQISEQVLYDSDGILIKFTGIESNNAWTTFKVYIENNSGGNINAYPSAFSVDGMMIIYPLDYFTDVYTINAGKKANTELSVENTVLRSYGIGEIKNVDILYSIYSADEVLADIEDLGKLHISLPTDDDVFTTMNGEVLAENEGVQVCFLDSDKDSYRFVVKNNTASDIKISLTDTYVNDYVYGELEFYGLNIWSGCQLVYTIELYPEFTAENSITDIEKIESIVTVTNMDSYEESSLNVIKVFE